MPIEDIVPDVKKIASAMKTISFMMIIIVALITLHVLFSNRDHMGDFSLQLPWFPSAAQQVANDTRTRVSYSSNLQSALK